MYKILKKSILAENTVLMTVDAPFVARSASAGQFVILRTDSLGERIPLTVADFDKAAGTVTIVFAAVGYTTGKLAKLSAGDFILDFAGPLGLATHYGPEVKQAVVIGGGAGCAIAYPQVKKLCSLGAKTHVIAGFRNKSLVILENEMRDAADTFQVVTDDGSYGKKGFVTDALSELLTVSGKPVQFDVAVAVGPVPMMRAVCEVTRPFGLRTIVSLNPIMIDGTGMCGCCRVTVAGKTRYACVEGPDFDGHEVDFDSLIRRNASYREQEIHICKIRG